MGKKTLKNLKGKFLSTENIVSSINDSSERKRDQKEVFEIWINPEPHIPQIRNEVENRTWKPREHEVKRINDGINLKIRKIVQPDYKYEQILHHMTIKILQDMFMRSMYEYSCASIPSRGCLYVKNYIEKFIKTHPKDCKYCLKLDVYHFFESIDIDILYEKLKKKIKDETILWVIDTILHTCPKIKGLPIGFYTSQWFANFYLTPLDHFIKEQLKVKCYVRYMDDMVMFSGNKRFLHKVFKVIKNKLSQLSLTIKSNWQVFRFDNRPLDFAGYLFFFTKTILRKRLLLKAKRKFKRFENKENPTWHDSCQIMSYHGYIKYTDVPRATFSNNYNKTTYIARKIMSEHSKRLSCKVI